MSLLVAPKVSLPSFFALVLITGTTALSTDTYIALSLHDWPGWSRNPRPTRDDVSQCGLEALLSGRAWLVSAGPPGLRGSGFVSSMLTHLGRGRGRSNDRAHLRVAGLRCCPDGREREDCFDAGLPTVFFLSTGAAGSFDSTRTMSTACSVDTRRKLFSTPTFCVGYGLSFGCRSAAGTCGRLASPSCSPRNDAASP